MKRFLSIAVLLLCAAPPVLSAPTVEFSPGGSGAGEWSYDGAGTFSFAQDITVDKGLGNPAGPLVGALVYIPDMTVGGLPSGPYTLTPVGAGTVEIRSTGGTLYMSGTLGVGDLVPVGTAGSAYTKFHADITNIVVTGDGLGLSSPALDAINSAKWLDFELSLQGVQEGFQAMLENNVSTSDGFSGAMTAIVPVPGAAILAGLGTVLIGWMRRRRAL
jgi:hypothetical protein